MSEHGGAADERGRAGALAVVPFLAGAAALAAWALRVR